MITQMTPDIQKIQEINRHCPFCGKQVERDVTACPSCNKSLYKGGRLSATVQAYLWAAIPGGVAFIVVKLAESLFSFQSRIVEMVIFGSVFMVAMRKKKAKLLVSRDLAVFRSFSQDDLSMAKKCPSCAEKIQSEALVCRFCGHQFSEADAAQAVRDHDDHLLRKQQAVQAEQNEREEKRLIGRYKRRLWFGIFFICIGALFIFIGILQFISFSSIPETSASEQKTAAVTGAVILGLLPLIFGLGLMLTARTEKQALVALRNSNRTNHDLLPEIAKMDNK